MSSPERAVAPSRGYGPYSRSVYEDPYYSQYASRPSSITPIIDEEVRYEYTYMYILVCNN